MIILQAGEENVGKWMVQEINIIDDYHKAFGERPACCCKRSNE
jgi:hypothetical protein